MGVRFVWLLVMAGLVAMPGLAMLTAQPAPNELVGGGRRCTIRVWDRDNPDDPSRRADFWGTIASANAEKIELVEAATELVAGKPLLEDPKKLPPAVWVRRMRERGKAKYTIRRDQILSIDVLDAQRLKQIMASYPPGTRCNIRTCDTSDPHDVAGYRDLWGKVGRGGEGGIELTEARDEPSLINPQTGSVRLLTDQARLAHFKTAGGGKFKVAPERIISIELLEQRPEKRAAAAGWVKETLF